MLLATAVLAAATAACGGDEPAPAASPEVTRTTRSPSPAALTKAEYVAAVNEVCDRVTKEAETIGEPKTATEYLDAARKAVRIIDSAQADVRALVPPPEDAAALEQSFLAVNDAQSAAFKAALPELESAARSGDDAAAENAFGEAPRPARRPTRRRSS
jgi:ABC-type glycerol-3-phosphate transport system substrate-binding protein